MKRWLPALAMGGFLAVAALTAVVVLRPGPEPSAAERADVLARGLRCPDCQGLSVADSPTSSAQEIRRQIDELVAGGATDDEVHAHFVARYGQWILLAPTSPAAWIIPIAVVIAGAAVLGAWLLSRRRADPAPPSALTAAQRPRPPDEVEALDA